MGTLADGPQILCARCAEIPEFLQFFRAILAPILRDLDAERAFFSALNAFSIQYRSIAMSYASFLNASKFCARGTAKF